MTDKVQKIRAELKRIMEACHDENGNPITYGEDCAYARLYELKEYIDSLQEEPVSEELEKMAKEYASDPAPILESLKYDCFKAGAKWQKEQMTNSAKKSKIIITSGGILLSDLKIEDFDYADKVKLIIIKENSK